MSAGFLALLVRLQWIDRKATSSYLIGMTLQTAVLTAGLVRVASDGGEALELATRAALFTCISVVLLAAMSSVQNEYRYGTIDNVLLARVPFLQLVAARALASAVVSSPAVLVPFAGAVIAFPETRDAGTVVVVLLVYVCLATVGYQTSLLLAQLQSPLSGVAWLRALFVVLGLAMVPFTGSSVVAAVLPTGAVLSFLSGGLAGTATAVVLCLGVCAGWTALLTMLFARGLAARLEGVATADRASL